MFPKTKRLYLRLFIAVCCVPLHACSKAPGDDRGKSKLQAKPEFYQMALISDLRGTFAPCGCTSKPLGGLARLASLLEVQTSKTQLSEILVLGDAFHDPDEHVLPSEQVKRHKEDLLLRFFERLGRMVMVPGGEEKKPDERVYKSLGGFKQIALLDGKKRDGTHDAITSVLKTYETFKIGLIGINKSAPNVLPNLSQEAVRLRAHGAEFVIALDAGPYIDFNTQVKEIVGIDVLFVSSTMDKNSEKIIGQTLVLTLRPKGQQLGFLKLVPKVKGQWVYDDQGRAKKKSLLKRIARLKESIEILEPGKARIAREKKLAELDESLTHFQVKIPKSSYVQWDVQDVAHTTEQAPWMAKELHTYNLNLCDLNAKINDQEPCVLDDKKSQFVGSAACKNCHPQAYEVYAQTKHAKAWATLEAKAKHCDFGCIGCHSVGFKNPGGYCRLSDADKFKNVGCENCHGPGSGHIKSPFIKTEWGPAFGKHSQEPQVCTQCHNQEHSDLFDYTTYLPQILGLGHGQKIESK